MGSYTPSCVPQWLKAIEDLYKPPGITFAQLNDEAMRSLLSDDLCERGFVVLEAAEGRKALRQVTAYAPDFIVTDFRMPAGGLGYVRRLRAVLPACPILLLTAFGDPDTKTQALACGVTAYLDKPIRLGKVREVIRQVL